MPRADTVEALEAVVADERALRPGVLALCRSLGIDGASLRRFPTGSLPVYAVEDAVIKLFPPVHAREAPVETAVLTAVHGRLPVATPGVRATGDHHGWRYVLMDRLPGTDLSSVWASLDRDRRRDLASQTGALVAAMHRVEPPDAKGQGWGDWPAFVVEQVASAVPRHRRWGLADQWLDQIPPYLASVELALDRPVLLHTEIMPANLLAREDRQGRWSLTGLCDFEPAMPGSPDYDFVAIGVFLAEGDPVVLRAALSAYGYTAEELDDDLPRRLLAWTLLHRYGNVASYLRRLPAPTAPTLDDLAERWFGAC